ncbi:SDR family NAD(P)-dependent oxidoreductase [Streptomyces sp. NPDC001889]
MSVLSGASILVTGGCGSLGLAFVRHVLTHVDPGRVVIYSRDEFKHAETRSVLGEDRRVRFVQGDIRDRRRLTQAMAGVDHVVHAAALKRVDTAEYAPTEYVKTNIDGSRNVIEAAVENRVRSVVGVSTDKASSPVNLYGATKLVADKLFTSTGATLAGESGTRFSVVRYGNFSGSRGSVVPLFRRLAAAGESLPVTDKRMTRFWMSIEHAVTFLVDSFELMAGGELFVPRIPSVRIMDLVEAIAPGAATHEVGPRPGERLHEEMISSDDSHRAFRLGDRYLVTSATRGAGRAPAPGWCSVPREFAYRSDSNDDWLSVGELKAMLERSEG